VWRHLASDVLLAAAFGSKGIPLNREIAQVHP
jgi:hypothetical protein